jgi:two-component system OmpR family response regulator
MRVLLVEDDRMIGEVIAQSLKDANYAVEWVQDGATALSVLKNQLYALVLLDLGLPKKDGIEVLRTIRARADYVPVLVVTARDAIEDCVVGLDSGADDYVVKPFVMAELLARMRAVLRRNDGSAGIALSNGTISLNPVTHEVTVDGVNTVLSGREFSLLRALLVRPGAILSMSELETRIYGWGEEVESNAVEFLIHSLRKKLGSQIIKNVRGVGWMVAEEA